METTSTLGTLTAAEVIDGVRAAREDEHAAALRQIQLAVKWALLHPCSEDSYPAGWGWTTLHEDGVIPLAGPGTPWSTTSPPPPWAPPSASAWMPRGS